MEKSSLLLSLQSGLCCGLGEAAPLPDLSVDGKVDLTSVLTPWLDEEISEQQVLD